jgi:hypothetical protein
MSTSIRPERIAELMKIEEQRFLDLHKASTAAFHKSSQVMHEGVPMSWMA